jgi:hypothetical protein
MFMNFDPFEKLRALLALDGGFGAVTNILNALLALHDRNSQRIDPSLIE